jgi:hypothetical protein
MAVPKVYDTLAQARNWIANSPEPDVKRSSIYKLTYDNKIWFIPAIDEVTAAYYAFKLLINIPIEEVESDAAVYKNVENVISQLPKNKKMKLLNDLLTAVNSAP